MQMVETQTQTVTLLDCNLPRTKSSSSDDSFTALMHAVLDSTRASGGSLESTSTSTSTASTSGTDGTADTTNTADSSKTSASGDGGGTSTRTSTTSDANAAIEMKGPSLAATGRTASASTTSSLASLAVPAASASASPSASAASSAAPSPCPSILRSSSSSLTLPSRTGSPSITFAPLPTTEPRKRSGVHPLGVAARSRLLRHRRMLREQGLHPDDVPYPYPFSEQDQEQGGHATLPRKTEVHLFDDPDARAPSAEGGVWEEDVDEESLKKLLAGPQGAPATAEKTPQEQRAPRTSIEPVANVKKPKRSSTMEVFAARIR
ncbi:hypothetical protein FKP32DRAFT_1600059 [Trametes sanguinea]|nr:hypothetical protein FKP32DRAFT_1600059 [Trametes sanguinea]